MKSLILIAVLILAATVYADEASDRFAEAQKRLAEKQKAATRPTATAQSLEERIAALEKRVAELEARAANPAPAAPEPEKAITPIGKVFTPATVLASIPANLRESFSIPSNGILRGQLNNWIKMNIIGQQMVVDATIRDISGGSAGSIQVAFAFTGRQNTFGRALLPASFQDAAAKWKSGDRMKFVGTISEIEIDGKEGAHFVSLTDCSVQK